MFIAAIKTEEILNAHARLLVFSLWALFLIYNFLLFVSFLKYSLAYCIISVVGIVGNLAVFAVVTRSPQMRTLTNQFIANLAVADLLVNILCVPFTLVANLYPGK